MSLIECSAWATNNDDIVSRIHVSVRDFKMEHHSFSVPKSRVFKRNGKSYIQCDKEHFAFCLHKPTIKCWDMYFDEKVIVVNDDYRYETLDFVPMTPMEIAQNMIGVRIRGDGDEHKVFINACNVTDNSLCIEDSSIESIREFVAKWIGFAINSRLKELKRWKSSHNLTLVQRII